MSRIHGLLLLAIAASCGPPATLPPPGRGKADPVQREEPQAAPAPKDPWADASKLIKPPAAAPAEALKLPPLTRSRLKNGLSVLVVPDEMLPLVSVKLLLRAGSIDDPAQKVGLADFTMMMLRQGVRGRSADQISSRIEATGAQLGISAGYESSTISCSGRSQTLDLCLQTVFELVAHPTFPQKEMKEIRDNLLGDVKQSRDDPSQLAALHFYNMLYGDDHPAGRPMTAQSVESITRRDLQRFHARHVIPSGAVLVLAGAVSADVAQRVKARFSAWRAGRPQQRAITPVADPNAGLRVLLVDKDDLTQSSFMIGHAGVNYANPARDALRLVDYVLGGGGFSSRLMQVVRSKGGKTYGISSAFYAHQADGLFRVTSSTRNGELVKTLQLVRGELRKIRSKPPTEKELTAAKGKMVGSYPIRFKTAAQLAAALALAQLRGLDDRYVTDFPLRVERQRVDAVAAAARAYVKPNQLVCAVVGKGSVVAPLLEAAKIPFSRISYLAPISARERATARTAATISPAEQRAGHALLERVVRANGGAPAFAKLRSARLQGRLERGMIPAKFTMLLIDPDHVRLALELALNKPGLPTLKMIQVLAGTHGFMLAQGGKQALPPNQLAGLRAMIWRQPAFLLRHAMERGVRLRPSKEAGAHGKLALEVFPARGEPLTLVFAPKTLRLVQLRRRGAGGLLRVTDFSDHRRVGRVWLPFRAETTSGKNKQSWMIESIEIAPKISKADITRESP